MRIAISGSTGLIGTALVHDLRAQGHTVLRLVRGRTEFPDAEANVAWDPVAGTIESSKLEGVDGVVHLSGRSIGAARWSDSEKRELVESRTRSTALLAETLAGLTDKPHVLLSGSAIGIYGDRGDEELTEQADRGSGFLADLCVAWEAASDPARHAGIRVATLRTGLVLAPKGGFLSRPVLLFKLGLGGRIGSGRQWWSWISIDDEVGAIRFLLDHDVSGPVNLTAPGAVTNAEFTRVLGRVLRRPTLFPVPRFAGRLALGAELADEVVFAGQRVVPAALTAAGYEFAQPTLEPALRAVLSRPGSGGDGP
jgi:uncharacterized protein (TIGR01777 family)